MAAQVKRGLRLLRGRAAFDHSVDDGAEISNFGLANESPVLLAQSCGADRILDQVVIYLDLAICPNVYSIAWLIALLGRNRLL